MQQLRIGRDTACEIVINDPTVSRTHATLIILGTTYSLRDEKSTNGTFVNGNRVSETVRLNDHDIVKVGNTVVPWRKYIPVSKAADPGKGLNTGSGIGEIKKKKKKKRVANTLIASALIMVVLGSMIVYFFYISQRPELRINATWVCDENCQDLKRLVFDKGTNGKGNYFYISGIGYLDTTRGVYNMDVENDVLKLSPGLIPPAKDISIQASAEASYKYDFKKNKLSLIFLENGIKKGDEITFVKLR